MDGGKSPDNLVEFLRSLDVEAVYVQKVIDEKVIC